MTETSSESPEPTRLRAPSYIPPPGHKDALVLDCRCDPSVNLHGEGNHLGIHHRLTFFVDYECDLHCTWDQPPVSVKGALSRLLDHVFHPLREH